MYQFLEIVINKPYQILVPFFFLLCFFVFSVESHMRGVSGIEMLKIIFKSLKKNKQ